MSTLNCDRYGCDNSMCNRRSPRFGLICDECFEELCAGSFGMAEFMETDKADERDFTRERREIFGEEFREI